MRGRSHRQSQRNEHEQADPWHRELRNPHEHADPWHGELLKPFVGQGDVGSHHGRALVMGTIEQESRRSSPGLRRRESPEDPASSHRPWIAGRNGSTYIDVWTMRWLLRRQPNQGLLA
jgi:hypothetical protein